MAAQHEVKVRLLSVLLRHMFTVEVHHGSGGTAWIGPEARQYPGRPADRSNVRFGRHDVVEDDGGVTTGPRLQVTVGTPATQALCGCSTTYAPVGLASPRQLSGARGPALRYIMLFSGSKDQLSCSEAFAQPWSPSPSPEAL